MNTARSWGTVLVVAWMLLSALPTPLIAERLATRRYTTADGLVGDYVIDAFRDSRGFLWFATRDGVSRFDGVRFVNYGMADGLPAATINHIFETRAGVYWVSTNGGGLCQFNPKGHRTAAGSRNRRPSDNGRDALFVQYRVGNSAATNRVNVAHEDRAGRLWVGTDDGLFQLIQTSDQVTFREIEVPQVSDVGLHGIFAIADDAEGGLWIGGGLGLVRLLPGGGRVVYRFAPESDRDVVSVIRIDDRQRVWVGFRSGLLRLQPAPAASFAGMPSPLKRSLSRAASSENPLTRGAARVAVEHAEWYTTQSGLPDDIVSSIYLEDDDHTWIGTVHGLVEFERGRLNVFTDVHGIPEGAITEIVEDTAGSLWLASVAGVTRLIRNGLRTYDHADGIPSAQIRSLGEDHAGRLSVVSGDYEISQFDGRRFHSTRPGALSAANCGWMSRCGMLDRGGDWWIPSTAGLFRWASLDRVDDLANRPPHAVYGSRNGLPEDSVYNTFEDRQGNIWIGAGSGRLLQWNRATDGWREFTERDGLFPLDPQTRLYSFVDHGPAGIWIGFDRSRVTRWRADRFQTFTDADGVPVGAVSSLLADAKGRIWIGATQGGLARVDQPQTDRPAFAAFTTADGLASDNVRCLVEDARGRIYVGTSRGLDRLDPNSGAVKHFSVSEGLASAFVTTAFRDRSGRLWFGTISGLSRLDDNGDGDEPAPAPMVFVESLQVAGRPEPVFDLGDAAPPHLVLAPAQNDLEIRFFGFSFETGAPLRYQYRLDQDGFDWTAPAESRTVTFAGLASGSYKFLVRAVNAGGVSGQPAVVSFRVLPPFYRRWWFLTLAAMAVAAVAIVMYRVRVAQLLRVERVRARIATDLHDDIGASLSQIAILAEVAREQMTRERGSQAAAAPLDRIAETSRTLVDSMSDIVWAINPEVDTLVDLVRRMRRFVEDTLGAGDIEVRLRMPDPSQDVKLGADVRREAFLILKESVTNIAKHSECMRVGIDFECSRHVLRLRVSDDGKGFDPSADTDGNGVASMRRRVAALGGHLIIDSAPGRGTTISFELKS